MSDSLPTNWKQDTLPKLSVNLDSKRIPLKSTDRDGREGPYRYYGASGVIDYIDEYIFDGEYILLGEDGENVVSRVLPLAFLVRGKFWVNNHAHVLQPKPHVDIKFLSEALEAIDYSDIASGSAQPKITQSSLNKVSIKYPPLQEQKKIATILTSVDSVIEKTQAQIDRLKDLKTGMMQELLTKGIGLDGKPHTEFKDSPVGRIPVGWDCSRIGNLIEIIDPQPDHRTPAEVAGGIPYVGFGDIDKSGQIDFKNARKVSKTAFEKQLAGFDIEPGAFIFGKIGTIGKPSLLPESRFYCLSANVVLVTCSDRELLDYIYFLFQSKVVNEQVLEQTNTTSQPAIGIKKLREFYVPIPKNRKELNDIVAALTAVQKKHDKKKKKKLTLNYLKKALMQDLLTGKVRTTPDA